MTDTTRVRLSYSCTIAAAILLLVGLIGMTRTTPAPWSRELAILALVLVIAGRVLRRRRRRPRP